MLFVIISSDYHSHVNTMFNSIFEVRSSNKSPQVTPLILSKGIPRKSFCSILYEFLFYTSILIGDRRPYFKG